MSDIGRCMLPGLTWVWPPPSGWHRHLLGNKSFCFRPSLWLDWSEGVCWLGPQNLQEGRHTTADCFISLTSNWPFKVFCFRFQTESWCRFIEPDVHLSSPMMSLQMFSTPPVWSRCQCVTMISWMLVLNCFSACLRLLMYSGTAGSPVSISTRLEYNHTVQNIQSICIQTLWWTNYWHIYKEPQDGVLSYKEASVLTWLPSSLSVVKESNQLFLERNNLFWRISPPSLSHRWASWSLFQINQQCLKFIFKITTLFVLISYLSIYTWCISTKNYD